YLVARFHHYVPTRRSSDLKLELRSVCGSHPLVVEINDVAVGAVVDDQWDDAAFAVRKLLRKLQDVTDGGTSEAVQALVIVTDHRSEEHTSELQSRFDIVCR